jgi:glycosyltransferase involved in cell wall biosynthesis
MSVTLNDPTAAAGPDAFVADPSHPFIPLAFQRLRERRAATRRPSRKNPRIVHYTGSLGSGGAERQLVNLVTALSERHFDVSVLSMEPLVGLAAFRLPAIAQRNILARAIERDADPTFSALRAIPYIGELVAQLPNWLKPWPFETARALADDPPDILHIWLDYTNIAGAIAALMLGIPKIILSTRSVNPTHFSYMNTPWFQPWYAFLATIPDLIFLNNSVAGQHDYAQWMNVSPARFEVIRNGIDTGLYCPAPSKDVAAFRWELGLDPHHQLLTGAFRFSEEKRPLLFLAVAESLMRDHPQLHTAILGHGPLESEFRAHINGSSFRGRIHLLAPRPDMPVVYSASEVLLQTSIVEGTPNTLLEAQATGCPVVTTPGGGSTECVLDQETGFVADNLTDLVERISRILRNRDLRSRLAQSGRIFVDDRFSLERMIGAYIDLYGRGPSEM